MVRSQVRPGAIVPAGSAPPSEAKLMQLSTTLQLDSLQVSVRVGKKTASQDDVLGECDDGGVKAYRICVSLTLASYSASYL
jgi:hypothetical protein